MEDKESVAVTSLENRLKFISSYGGKILPRPSDGQLKYIGGDTRVFAFPRSVSFSEVMEKIRSAYAADVLVKYQLMPEDLDALISVKSDEDFGHMVDEYDRQVLTGSSRFRLYLFPDKITDRFDNAGSGSQNKFRISTLERRYIDAINNVNVNHREASPSSSPTSTITCDSASFRFSRPLHKVYSSPSFSHAGAMHKAHSSPNLHVMGKQATPASESTIPPFPRAYGHHYTQSSRSHKLRRNHDAVFSRKVGSPPLPTVGQETNGPVPRHLSRHSRPSSLTDPHNEGSDLCNEFCCCCCCLRRQL